MADTTARALRLLSLLQDHRFWPGPELAERLEVSERTLRRDVDRLRGLGYPVDARRGAVGGYQLVAGRAMPPLVLDDDEAVALGVGLHTAGVAGVAGLEDASVRALAKLAHVMPSGLRQRVDALASVAAPPWTAASQVAPAVLSTLAQACRDAVRASFAYVARDDARSDRYVEPHQLVVVGGRWYLLGHDLDRDGWRTFRLDRITDVQVTRNRFDRRSVPGDDAAAYVQGRLRTADATIDVEVLLFVAAAGVGARWLPWVRVEPIDDGSCRLRMATSDLDWALFVLAGIDADFEVVRPVELVERVAAVAARFERAGRRRRTPPQRR